MITIKFPKSPRTIQRTRAQEIGKKYKYSEDEFYSTIVMDYVTADLKMLIETIYGWNFSSCEIDGEEVCIKHLCNILDCIQNSLPSTDLKWYDVKHFMANSINEIKSTIDDLSDDKKLSQYTTYPNYKINWLQRCGVICDKNENNEYNVEKEKLSNLVNNSTILIRKIFPEFSNLEILQIIKNFPEKIKVKELQETNDDLDDTEEIEDYDDTIESFMKDALELLRKIELNTRK